ncbi:MAG: choice-of-anchor D domain-containing protein [Gemmatimonadota bacterium]|nr:MAG: choice-of-anchor D domain-containing protein [Gemmatimonadota bacterium]
MKTYVLGMMPKRVSVCGMVLLAMFLCGRTGTAGTKGSEGVRVLSNCLADTVTVTIGKKTAPAGAVFTVPIYVTEDLAPYGVLSMEFRLLFNASLLSFRTVAKGEIILDNKYRFFYGHQGNRIFVATAGEERFEGSGTLALVEFRVLATAQEGQTATFSFERFLFNEAAIGPATRTVAGSFTVGSYPDIEVSELDHDFGELSVGDSAFWTVRISNEGWADLIVESMSGILQDFGVISPLFPYQLASGGYFDATVFFAPANLGLRTDQLIIRSNDYFEEEIPLFVKGVGIAPDIALSAREHSFGQVPVGYTADWTFHVFNVGTDELNIDSVAAYPQVFTVFAPSFPQTVAVGETLAVSTRFMPVEHGQTAGVLSLFNNDPDENPIDLFLSGIGIPAVPEISVPVTAHDYDGIYIGSTGEWMMPIANVGTAPLTVDSIVSTRDEFQVTSIIFPQTVNPVSGIDVTVDFRPESVDAIRGTLMVYSDDTTHPVVMVTLTGYGLEPAILTVLGGQGNPGTVANQVPVAMENQWPISSIEFVLSYPESVLTVTAAIPTERSQNMALFQVDLHYGVGKVKLSVSDQTQTIQTGSGSIVKFAISVAEDAPLGTHPLTLSEVMSFDDQGRHVSFVMRDSVFAVHPVGVLHEEHHGREPQTYALFQNYPNPFNPETMIHYSVAGGESPAHVTLAVYNLLGQEVKVLVSEPQKAGYYTVMWDGIDSSGRIVPSGVYLCRFVTAGFVNTKKMILTR